MKEETWPSGPMATMIVAATRQRGVQTMWVCERAGNTGVFSIFSQNAWNAGDRDQIHRSGFIAAGYPDDLVDEIGKEFEEQGCPVHVNGGKPLVEGANAYGILIRFQWQLAL